MARCRKLSTNTLPQINPYHFTPSSKLSHNFFYYFIKHFWKLFGFVTVTFIPKLCFIITDDLSNVFLWFLETALVLKTKMIL